MSKPDSTKPHTFREGDLVREKGGSTIYELDDVNPAPADVREKEGEYWASGMSNWNSQDWESPDDVVLVLSAADAAKRTVPTATQIASQVASGLHGGFSEHVNVTETEAGTHGTFTAYGTTDLGLTVGFTVTVSNIERAD
ncbi:hypothetical protein [Frigoribacterium sp. VKM Ac-2530]|uniref:hypothetical protein n=1 Tax=Frigoribacterium sp. VKM Ac-2530 TaxID=2783822 RepID=UPI00188C7D3C|nr:hypothetical protein [Frigoribacterium sp. VKM Ac-2530]MBF4578902.1 hypothetical protein [Frigoribacterium sp. VKM Ac-2530]